VAADGQVLYNKTTATGIVLSNGIEMLEADIPKQGGLFATLTAASHFSRTLRRLLQGPASGPDTQLVPADQWTTEAIVAEASKQHQQWVTSMGYVNYKYTMVEKACMYCPADEPSEHCSHCMGVGVELLPWYFGLDQKVCRLTAGVSEPGFRAGSRLQLTAGTLVRVVMCSIYEDVGITLDLTSSQGYSHRIDPEILVVAEDVDQPDTTKPANSSRERRPTVGLQKKSTNGNGASSRRQGLSELEARADALRTGLADRVQSIEKLKADRDTDLAAIEKDNGAANARAQLRFGELVTDIQTGVDLVEELEGKLREARKQLGVSRDQKKLHEAEMARDESTAKHRLLQRTQYWKAELSKLQDADTRRAAKQLKTLEGRIAKRKEQRAKFAAQAAAREAAAKKEAEERNAKLAARKVVPGVPTTVPVPDPHVEAAVAAIGADDQDASTVKE